MDASAVTEEVVERANELYWGSDRSVNQIAEELDLSKGALYGIVEPQPAGLGCPLCGSEVLYSNRTAKDRGRLDCGACEWDGSPDEAAPLDEEDAHEQRVSARMPAAAHDSDRRRTMAGGALLGAAVGLALVMWARRR